MYRKLLSALTVSLLAVAGASAAVTFNTTHGPDNHALDGSIAIGDIISGLIATELPGDNGWHPANPASGDSMHPDGLPAFTDDTGALDGVTGLLNDFPGAGNPTKMIQYDLGGATDISQISILTGNGGNDGRVFSTTVVRYSTDNGANFADLGYFQSDPSGTINGGEWGATLVDIFDDGGADIISGATNIQFYFYAVDNTGGQIRDPYDGVNPYTGIDDGLSAAFVSPLVYEIDVIPEPAGLVLLALGGLALLRRR